MAPLRIFWLLVLTAPLPLLSYAEENNPVNTGSGKSGDPPRIPAEIIGARVEIVPRGGSRYSCYLLGFKTGVLELKIDSGERRVCNADEIEEISFLPQPGRPKISDKDGEPNKPIPIEHAPATPAPSLQQRLRAAHSVARKALDKGKLELNIQIQQQKLINTQSNDEARDTLLILAFAHHMKGGNDATVLEALQIDATAILNPAVRKKTLERVNEILESTHALKKIAQ